MWPFKKKAFKIKADRTSVSYREGGRAVSLYAEHLFGDAAVFNYYIRLSDLEHWQEPRCGIPITAADKERIKKNVNLYLGQRGYRIDWG